MWRKESLAWRSAAIALLVLAVLAPLVSAAPPKDKHDWGNLKQLAHDQQIQIVMSDAKSYRGEFQSFNEEAVVVRVATGIQTFPRKDVLRISTRGKRHTRRNILVGTVVGFGIGVAAGAAICQTDSCSGALPPMIGAGTGAPLGALAGYVMPTGGWHDVYRVR